MKSRKAIRLERRKRLVTRLGILAGLALVLIIVRSMYLSAGAMGSSATETRIDAWVNQLNDSQLTPARHLAQQHLEEAGPASVGPLVSALHSPNIILRRNAAEMLGFIGSPLAINALTGALKDDVAPSVRDRAAWALGEINNVGVFEALRQTSAVDSSAQVRKAAQDSIGAIRSRLAIAAGKDPSGVRAFAVTPGRSNLVYIAGVSGIYISEDAGVTWSPLMSSPPSRVSALLVSPTNPNVLYAGTESSGLYMSEDRGATWTSRNDGLGLAPGVRLGITAIAVNQQDPDRVYIASGKWVGTSHAQLIANRIRVSRDGAKSWEQAELTVTDTPVTELVVSDDQLFAVSGDQIVTTKI